MSAVLTDLVIRGSLTKRSEFSRAILRIPNVMEHAEKAEPINVLQ